MLTKSGIKPTVCSGLLAACAMSTLLSGSLFSFGFGRWTSTLQSERELVKECLICLLRYSEFSLSSNKRFPAHRFEELNQILGRDILFSVPNFSHRVQDDIIMFRNVLELFLDSSEISSLLVKAHLHPPALLSPLDVFRIRLLRFGCTLGIIEHH